MTIVEAMKDEDARLRINNGSRWLVYSSGEWRVYEHRYYQRGTTLIIATVDESEAVAKLLDDAER